MLYVHSIIQAYDLENGKDINITGFEWVSPQHLQDDFGVEVSTAEWGKASERWDQIAKAMWEQYIAYNEGLEHRLERRVYKNDGKVAMKQQYLEILNFKMDNFSMNSRITDCQIEIGSCNITLEEVHSLDEFIPIELLILLDSVNGPWPTLWSGRWAVVGLVSSKWWCHFTKCTCNIWNCSWSRNVDLISCLRSVHWVRQPVYSSWTPFEIMEGD